MSEITTVGALPPIPMTLSEGSPRVTSRDVADIFGKQHKNVLQAVGTLDCSEGFRQLNFQPSTYLNAQNKPQPMVEMTRDGFTFLAMGFTGPRAAAFKEAFIEAFNAMEAQLRGGSALPAIAQAVTQMQAQMHALAERQAEDGVKLAAILDLVDVTKRYVGVLETNQKTKRRALRAVTPEIEASIMDLLAQGMPGLEVALQCGVSTATVSLIKNGKWSSAFVRCAAQARVAAREGGRA